MKNIRKEQLVWLVRQLFINVLQWCVPAWICFVFLIRLTVRDQYIIITSIYYAMRLPLVALLALGSFLLLFLFKKRRYSWLNLILAVISLFWWLSVNCFVSSQKNKRGDFRVLSWNLYKQTEKEYEEVARVIKSEDVDVAGFMEFGEGGMPIVNKLKKRLPGYSVKLLDDCMFVAVKGDVLSDEVIYIGDDDFGRYNRIVLKSKGRKMVIYLVDMGSSPHHPRNSSLAEMYEDAMTENAEYFIIMGDFNTPYESSCFDSYRKSFRYAFADSGNGFIESYPLPVPLLSLDHLWHCHNLISTGSRLVSNYISDHKYLVVDLNIKKQ